MGVVGGDEGQTGFPGQAQDALIHPRLLGDAVILQFEIEVLRPEDLRKLQGLLLRPGIIIVHQTAGDLPCQAGGQGDEAPGMPAQQLQIHPGLAVKALLEGAGDHLAQIPVAFLVFAQQHQVPGLAVEAVDTVAHAARGHIDLAADDGAYAGGLGGLVKINDAVHNAVVRDGHGVLPQRLDPLHDRADAACAVEQAVFGMDVKMNECHSYSFASSTNLRIL